MAKSVNLSITLVRSEEFLRILYNKEINNFLKIVVGS